MPTTGEYVEAIRGSLAEGKTPKLDFEALPPEVSASEITAAITKDYQDSVLAAQKAGKTVRIDPNTLPHFVNKEAVMAATGEPSTAPAEAPASQPPVQPQPAEKAAPEPQDQVQKELEMGVEQGRLSPLAGAALGTAAEIGKLPGKAIEKVAQAIPGGETALQDISAWQERVRARGGVLGVAGQAKIAQEEITRAVEQGRLSPVIGGALSALTEVGAAQDDPVNIALEFTPAGLTHAAIQAAKARRIASAAEHAQVLNRLVKEAPRALPAPETELRNPPAVVPERATGPAIPMGGPEEPARPTIRMPQRTGVIETPAPPESVPKLPAPRPEASLEVGHPPVTPLLPEKAAGGAPAFAEAFPEAAARRRVFEEYVQPSTQVEPSPQPSPAEVRPPTLVHELANRDVTVETAGAGAAKGAKKTKIVKEAPQTPVVKEAIAPAKPAAVLTPAVLPEGTQPLALPTVKDAIFHAETPPLGREAYRQIRKIVDGLSQDLEGFREAPDVVIRDGKMRIESGAFKASLNPELVQRAFGLNLAQRITSGELEGQRFRLTLPKHINVPNEPAVKATTETMDTVVDQQYRAERARIKAAGQRGAVLVETPFPQPPAGIPAATAEVEHALQGGWNWRRAAEDAKTAIDNLREMKDQVTGWVKLLPALERVNPAAQNQMRLLIGSFEDARQFGMKSVNGIIGSLKDSPAGYEVFRRIVVLRDLVAGALTAENLPRLSALARTRGLAASDQLAFLMEPVDFQLKGLALPEGIKVEDAAAHLMDLIQSADPAMLDAVRRHNVVVEAVGRDMVARGLLPEEVVGKPYFHHVVMDTAEATKDYFPAPPTRLKTPFRGYLKTRIGSVKEIDTDYIPVMTGYFTRVKFNNLLEDGMEAIAREHHVLDKLTPEQRMVAFGTEGKPPINLYQPVKIGDRTYAWWQPEPGRQFFAQPTLPARLVTDAALMNDPVVMIARQAIGEGLMMGKIKPAYLLETELVDALNHFRQPYGDLLRVIAPPVQLLKSSLLKGLNFLGWSTLNYLTDLLKVFVTDWRALAKFGEAGRTLVSPEQYTKLLDLVNQHRLFQAGTYDAVGRALPFDSELIKLMKNPMLRLWYTKKNPWFTMDLVRAFQESQPRLMKFMADLERIQNGQPVIVPPEQLRGLDLLSGTAKGNRYIMIDYDSVGPGVRAARNSVLPFVTWYEKEIPWWYANIGRLLKNLPALIANKLASQEAAWYTSFLQGIGMLGTVAAGMSLWNWTKYPEIEQDLPSWEQQNIHLITGEKSPEGRAIIFRFQTAQDVAMQTFALDQLPELVRRVRAGELTPMQAAKEQLALSAKAPLVMGYRLLNPVLQLTYSLARNRDSFTGRQIVPTRYQAPAGAPLSKMERNLMLEYSLEQVFTPYTLWRRQQRRERRNLEPSDPWVLELLGWGPESVRRAIGIREVDLGAGRREAAKQVEGEHRTQELDKINDWEQAYVDWQVAGGTNNAFATRQFNRQVKAIMEAAGEPIEHAKTLLERAKSPAVRLAIIQRQLDTIRDVDTRRRLLDEADLISRERDVLMLKKAPALARAEMVKKLRLGTSVPVAP